MKNKFYKKRQQGQVLILTTVFFLIVGLMVISGISFTALKDTVNARNTLLSKTSYYVSESGIEDTLYRLKNGILVDSNNLVIDGNSSSVTIENNGDGTLSILSHSATDDFYKRIKINMVLGTGISFHYAVQGGMGGFQLNNTSSINGNVYSNGPVVGSGNDIFGDVVSSGLKGEVYGIHATGSVYAHFIGTSTVSTHIDKDAYYQNISNTVVSGTHYPNSIELGTTSLPISDQQIQKWENDALAGGLMLSSECDSYNSSTRTCTISTDKTIGPKKIPFNLSIKSSNKTLTIAGALWIVGNLEISNQPIIKMSSSLGNQNVAIIADNPSDTMGSGKVTVSQGVEFAGSGFPGSYVFIISQNNSAENGGIVDAISMSQGAAALIAYASHGQINMSQSVSVKSVTGYKIVLSNSANVIYDTGLPSYIFSNGPSGGYNVINWEEI